MPKFIEVPTDDFLKTTQDAKRYRWLRAHVEEFADHLAYKETPDGKFDGTLDAEELDQLVDRLL